MNDAVLITLIIVVGLVAMVVFWQQAKRGRRMSSFEERWGSLTVEQCLELNKIAHETCAMEATCLT